MSEDNRSAWQILASKIDRADWCWIVILVAIIGDTIVRLCK